MEVIIEGLLLGFAYVMPIGAQNLFVIQSSLSNSTKIAYRISSIVILMDVSLALACFFGIGVLVREYNIFANILQLIGGLYLIKISVSLVLSKVETNIQNDTQKDISFLKSAFVLTWLNPQALVDGSILLGSFNHKHNQNASFFILGVCLASIIWFYSLTTIIRIFHKKISSKSLRIINIFCGIVLFYLGSSLLISLIIKTGTL